MNKFENQSKFNQNPNPIKIDKKNILNRIDM